MSWKLGSLFDGSGGFPLAGILCDIEPRWASEIEPYPIAVTRSRFPNMKHLGDISTINGAEVEPVDIITFGSPCQDLSVAGKRAGLKHEVNGDEETTRSGLFMEAVRIIKEMKEATNGEYPRFALWENVPGAFSSNKGEDFRIVLEELIKIVEPGAVMPAVPKKGWPYADSYVGDGWSIAYRVFDAQYWGVPQRRRRIHLVADLRGTCAREVLFEREGVRGYFAKGGTAWESLAADAEGGLGAADHERTGLEDPAALSYGVTTKGNGDAFIAEERHTALTGGGGQAGQGYPCAMIPYTPKIHTGCEDERVTGVCLYNQKTTGVVSKAMTASASDADHVPCVLIPYTLKIRSGCEGGGKGALIQTNQSATLSTLNDQYLFQPVPEILLDDQGGQQISVRSDGKSPTLRAEAHGNVPCVIEAAGFKELNSAKARSNGYGHEVCPTLSAEKHDASVCVGVLASSAVNAEHTDGSISPCLMARAGTGGNQLPLVAVKTWDARGNGDGDTANTITGDHENRITDYTSVVIEELPAYSLQGNTVDRDAKQNGCGVCENVSHTLNSVDRHAVVYGIDHAITTGGNCTAQGPCVYEDVQATLKATGPHAVAYAIDQQGGKGGANYAEDVMPTLCSDSHGTPHAVAYAMQGFGDYKESDVASGLKARDYKDATDLVAETQPIAIDRAFFNQGQNALYDPHLYEEGVNPPLIARGPNAVCVRYIVRRLTPTECARLQGFADRWGEIEEKESFTEAEYRFWLDVRNTHAAINGKAVKDYTEKQMLTWYNKLRTDSAEYKMWGNGIALLPALYCMQGIVDVLKREHS